MIRSRARARGGYKSIYWAVRKAFATGRDGYLHDFSNLASLNQLSTGTTPVTIATDPVGFVADTRLGMALGPELVVNGEFTSNITGWASINSATLAWSAGKISVTSNGALNGATSRLVSGFTVGKTYKLSGSLTSSAGNGVVFAGPLAGGGSAIITLPISAGEVTGYFVATATSLYIGAQNGTATSTNLIEYLRAGLFEGNHAIQATAAARPTWQVDATGYYYLALLGTDDCLTSATGGGGTNGFFWCGVVRLTGGAGTARELFSDSGANTGIHVEIDAANKLSMSAGNGVAFTTLASTATVNVGTQYLLTAYISAGAMYVQIDSAAAESTAAPTITAGTAGFTLGKDNLLASDFLIGHLYPSVYWRDTAGTAAEVADAQAYCRMMGGM